MTLFLGIITSACRLIFLVRFQQGRAKLIALVVMNLQEYLEFKVSGLENTRLLQSSTVLLNCDDGY